MSRRHVRAALSETTFDVAIIGGGVNGACLYDRLAQRGYRVVLADKGDFSSGTSSESGMLVWGGLLYLRQFDLSTVIKLCRSRDRMVRDLADVVRPTTLLYCASRKRPLQAAIVLTGLYLYWTLGVMRRRAPRPLFDAPESRWLSEGGYFLSYEEAALQISDARFVMGWLSAHDRPEAIPVNYLEVVAAKFDRAARVWHVEAIDHVDSCELSFRARTLVNCAGVWTDRVNAAAGIETPIRHAFSKGVYAGFDRPEGHDSSVIFEQGEHGDVLTSVPWGPIALWGPTETGIEDIESGFAADEHDLRFLLKHRHRCLKLPSNPEQIVSIRCGVRPLAVDRNYRSDRYTLELSRRHYVISDREVPWISTFGGKLTGCMEAAAEVEQQLTGMVGPTGSATGPSEHANAELPCETFPGMPSLVPSVQWCIEREHCVTLEDYLRRRTNIAQWIPREGLGPDNSNSPRLHEICMQLCRGDQQRAGDMLDAYARRVESQFDDLLRRI